MSFITIDPGALHPHRRVPRSTGGPDALSTYAIDVRESCEPDVPLGEVGPLIRDLERELAREWGASRRYAEPGSLLAGPRS